jgi:eukaryotic-like serine/threonine-protein kinase
VGNRAGVVVPPDDEGLVTDEALRWARVKRIFEEALARTPEDRHAYLEQECGADRALHAEVMALLNAHVAADAESFAQQPAIEVLGVAGVVTPTVTIGDQLTHYRIESVVGAGGMGVVYKARDTRPKLDRTVAIKVLAPDLRGDPDLLQRFERESRALAALNHAHICTVFDVDRDHDVDFLVMEYVAGATLADRLSRSGRLPLKDALTIAGDIADALDAAHSQGIVHRDLKPANIKFTPDGVVKLLDFGLAKIIRDEDARDRSPSSTNKTREGTTMGTVAYMSPEQARGEPVDKRADVWALGCVLYEMLTAQVAFPGNTASDTIAAVLTREPDWRALPQDTPPSIRQLLRRCLERDLTRRLRDIGDARIEIADAVATPLSESDDVRDRHSEVAIWVRVAISAAVLALVAVPLTTFIVNRRASPPSDAPAERRFEIVTPPSDPGSGIAISPDGETLAFAAESGSETKLWLHSLRSGSQWPLAGTGGASNPFWSPDSRSLVFHSRDVASRTPGQHQLKRIDIESGAIETLGAVGGIDTGTWSRDGVILFSPVFSGPIARMNAAGGSPVVPSRRATFSFPD